MANNMALVPSRGGALGSVPNAERSGCFCTRDALQDYGVVLSILALAKTVTPEGSPRQEPGQAAPPTT